MIIEMVKAWLLQLRFAEVILIQDFINETILKRRKDENDKS